MKHDETPVRSRTRTAILQAALSIFMLDRSASLADVAERAHVARSTLHRYFPERTDLMAALGVYAKEQVREIAIRARVEDGNPRDALSRLCYEYFERWDAVMWDYIDVELDPNGATQSEWTDGTVTALIDRGQQSGEIDPSLPGAWIQHAMYAMVYSAWEYARNGHPRHDAANLCIRSFQKLITPA